MSMFYIGITSLVISVVGGAVQYSASQDAADAAEATAAANSKLQREQANQEMAVASENAKRAEQQKNRTLRAIIATNAANGLAMEGTPLEVLGDTAMDLEREILDIGFAAENQRRALLAGAWNSQQEGANTAASLRAEGTAGLIKSAGSAVGGYANASGMIAPKSSAPKPLPG